MSDPEKTDDLPEESKGNGAIEPQNNATNEGENSTPANKRPERVDTFLFEGDVFEGWHLENSSKNRFYLVNLETVMSRLGVKTHSFSHTLDQAQKAIIQDTDWRDQYFFDFKCSNTQLKNRSRFAPKLFDRAATIIVAMELRAKEVAPEYNVYDYLRIVPATYFVDEFRLATLRDLEAHFRGFKPEEKADFFGEHAARTFQETALGALGQKTNGDLLSLMATGYTATRWMCDGLRQLVQDAFPEEYHLGATLHAGSEDAADYDDEIRLGSKAAAKSLKVPRNRQPGQLNPCY
ncbi:MAG: hypothetical protein AAGH57_06140 [Pseudomonadota bacterium]